MNPHQLSPFGIVKQISICQLKFLHKGRVVRLSSKHGEDEILQYLLRTNPTFSSNSKVNWMLFWSFWRE